MGFMQELAQLRRDAGRGSQGQFAQIKSMFFDRQAVKKILDDRSRKVLNHFGALCMRIARNSIKSTFDVSQPGQPPSSHVGAQNKQIRKMYKDQGRPQPNLHRGIKEIYYSYDRQTQSVVIGPIRFNSSELSGTHKRVSDTLTTLELLEYGGTVMKQVAPITLGGVEFWIHSPAVPPRQCTYRPRPFMGPAFRLAEEKLPDMWAGSVK